MKTRFAPLPVVVMIVVMILTFEAASAQNLNAGIANVPFSFVANHQALPAGCYQVKLVSNAILTLVNCGTGQTVGVMVHTANGYPAITHGSLVFRVAGREPRLLRVRFRGTNIQSDLSVQPKPEHQSARAPASRTTEIAMK